MATWYVDSNASSIWAATTAYSLGDRVFAITTQYVIFECTTAGTSGGSEPTWDATPGNTTADSGATWTARAFSTGWADAAPHLGYADNVASSGDTVLVASDHSYTSTGNTSCLWSGSLTAPVLIVSTNKTTGQYEPGAVESTAPSSYYITTLTGHSRYYGVTFKSQYRAVIADQGNLISFEDCSFVNIDTSANSQGPFLFEYDQAYRGGPELVLKNCTLDISANGNTTQSHIFQTSGALVINVINMTFIASNSAPSYLIQAGSSSYFKNTFLRFSDCDLSFMGSNPLVRNSADDELFVSFHSCKLGTNYTLKNASTLYGQVRAFNCIDGQISQPATGISQTDLRGDIITDTSVYRSGGAYDGAQANASSWKLTSTGNALELYNAMESPPIVRWCEAGSQTLTIHVAGGATMNDDDFWVEVSSPNETASPNQTAQGNFQSTRAAPLATPVALTTDSVSTWNGTGVGTKQKIDVTINPTEPGPVTVRCFLAKPSTTVYVDPKIGVA